MSEQEKKTTDPRGNLFETWAQYQADTWETAWRTAAEMWPAAMRGKEEKDNKQGSEESSKPFYELWNAYLSLLTKAGSADDKTRISSSLPEWIMKFSQPMWATYFSLQKQWLDGGTEPDQWMGVADQVRKATEIWFKTWEKEFKPVLNIPPLGLTRYHQERFNQAIEKYSAFQAALTDFLHDLMSPMEKSFQAIQEEIKGMDEKNRAAIKDSKAFYQLWIKKLEQNYMVLLRSPEYIERMSRTLKAYQEYRVKRQRLFMDLLQDWPVPTHAEMDELYKDLYLLKKRVRDLEKKVKNHGR